MAHIQIDPIQLLRTRTLCRLIEAAKRQGGWPAAHRERARRHRVTSGRSLPPANAPLSRPPHGNCKLPFEPICYAGTHCKLSPNEMEQVVATPELVDMIFAHMSRQENTTTALVCKSWLEHSRDHIWCEVQNPKELFCLLVPLKTAPDLVRRSFLMAERLLT